jgi:hypothetical protein
MIDESIGIIGKIQGVKESKRPKPKNVIKTTHRLLLDKVSAILFSSDLFELLTTVVCLTFFTVFVLINFFLELFIPARFHFVVFF